MQTKEIDRFPTFFIAGAPRCGTTAMSKYLAANPQIGFSKPKEPHFFSILLKKRPNLDLRSDYVVRFFSHIDASHKAIGDGSVSYLYSPEAIERILTIQPEAKFIVMVRNPIEMVYSFHSRMLITLDEDQQDFPTAWNLQSLRARGEQIPKNCHDAGVLEYLNIGSLGKHVERLFQVAGRERCLVVVYDDFASDPLGAYRNILQFIGVDYDGRTHFPRAEGNKYIRSRLLQRWLKRPPAKVADFVLTMDRQRKGKVKGKRKKTLVSRVRKWLIHRNNVEVKRAPLDPETRKILHAAFAEDIDKLSGVLGRDLGHWS